MTYMARDVYGGVIAPQPTPNASPGHAPGPEPMARTVNRPTGTFANPTLLLVLLLGIAIVLIQFSVGFEVRVSK